MPPENEKRGGTNPDRTGDEPKISTGTNDRPRNATIGGTGGGLPDDSGRAIAPDPEEERRIAEKIRPAKPAG
ncbi:hypothetical protein [Jiella sp. M17.18]|uniref:hypothetical protein n=1 Tax=Jiella sp. M17.18 TaxID=3234247 RepID=UPI0034DDF04D